MTTSPQQVTKLLVDWSNGNQEALEQLTPLVYGELRRGLVVLKMRGSRHDQGIHEFTIDSQGMHIGHPLRTPTGIL